MMVCMTELWPAPFSATPITHTVSVPGSKSLTNRALPLAALALLLVAACGWLSVVGLLGGLRVIQRAKPHRSIDAAG